MKNRSTKTNRFRSPSFRRLTGTDLITFDREAKDLIREAMEIGCLGRISAKGHCILRNNAGGTASVPPNLTSANRTAQNVRADMRRLLAGHRHDMEPSASRRTPRQAQRMTVSQAFVEYSAAFSRWFDGLPGGLPADQLLNVTFDKAGQPVFETVQTSADAQVEAVLEPETTIREKMAGTPDSHQWVHHLTIAPEQETNADISAAAQPINASAVATDDPEKVLQRVRTALGEDPRIARLENRITELEAALAREKQRADEAQVRLSLIQEAFHA
ncbi:hypothetical protein [Saccharopolyspora hattusasensis]|uniref:hypothetical protein n=1 Tax=Saccharopolyspora hattusasensis TaxID=1128679 RepID=UPI003D98C402